jgi:hypothetical protein
MAGGHLQHGRMLALAQLRQHDDRPIGKLERIVMGVRPVHIDWPELSYLERE